MRVVVVLVVVSTFLCMPATSDARDKGPTLKSVTKSILNIVPDDGRWYPQGRWWAAGLDAGQELKVLIKTSKGKKVAWATFSARAKASGDFAKVSGTKKIWPVDKTKYAKLKKLVVGKYRLDVLYGKKVVWTTPFEILNDKFAGKNHFYAVGPWVKLAYFTFSKGSVGSRICGWFAPPRDTSWFSKKRHYRGFSLTGDIKKAGAVVVKDAGSANRPLQIDRGRVAYVCKGISHWREVREKVASKDGTYLVSAYASTNVKGKRRVWPVLQLEVKVSGGKVVINDALTGAKAPAKTRIITSDAYYGPNKGSLAGIPKAADM
jgi:hypothetical protein